MAQLAQKNRQRRVDDPEGIAIAEGPIGAPAREPVALQNRFVILKQEVDVVTGVVRAPELAWLKQRPEGNEAVEENEQAKY